MLEGETALGDEVVVDKLGVTVNDPEVVLDVANTLVGSDVLIDSVVVLDDRLEGTWLPLDLDGLGVTLRIEELYRLLSEVEMLGRRMLVLEELEIVKELTVELRVAEEARLLIDDRELCATFDVVGVFK